MIHPIFNEAKLDSRQKSVFRPLWQPQDPRYPLLVNSVWDKTSPSVVNRYYGILFPSALLDPVNYRCSTRGYTTVKSISQLAKTMFFLERAEARFPLALHSNQPSAPNANIPCFSRKDSYLPCVGRN